MRKLINIPSKLYNNLEGTEACFEVNSGQDDLNEDNVNKNQNLSKKQGSKHTGFVALWQNI